MDANVAYWTAALLNMAVVMGFASSGLRHARRGDYVRHRARMVTAASFVLAFLVSYAIKLALLGREQLDQWTRSEVWTLRAHELCVLALVAGGITAGTIALRRGMPRPGAQPADPGRRAERAHRIAGRIALAGGAFGLLLAGVVLWGMYARLP